MTEINWHFIHRIKKFYYLNLNLMRYLLYLLERIDITIEEDLFLEVIEHLLKDNASRSWKIFENIVLFSPNFDLQTKPTVGVVKTVIEKPIVRALEFEVGEEFLLKLVEHLHWKDMDALEILMKKNYLNVASKIIFKKGRDWKIMEPPIVTATKLAIPKG